MLRRLELILKGIINLIIETIFLTLKIILKKIEHIRISYHVYKV